MKNFYRDGGLVLSVAALVVVILAISAMLYVRDSVAFWIFTPFIVLTSGFAIGKLILVTRKTFQYFTIIKNELDLSDSASLYHSPIAIGIIDREHRFIWFNAAFLREFKPMAQHGNPLDTITTASMDLLLSDDGARVKCEDKYYKINVNVPNVDTANEIFIVYFENITNEVVLKLEKKLSQPVVVLIMIDSYEEIFSGGSESTRASVMVQIDKLLEDYIQTTNGVMRKAGSSRFWAVIEERHVQQLIDGKVKILDKAREISVTDRITVTLSIGVGKTGKDMAESEIFARQALEMALGRGGDQAAVKTKSGFEFYGGFSKGIERHTKVRARIIANSLLDLANNADIIYIMGHKFSDLDSIGASVGLACGLRNLGKSAYIVIDKATSLGIKLIEKVESHEKSKDNNAGLFIETEKARDAWTAESLLIIVDVHNKKLLEDVELYESAEKVVVIDHHRKMVDFIENAKIFHHEVTASSASEMVAELLQYFGAAGVVDGVQAEALLAGIVLDTKNFSIKTGVRTFEAAAYLRRMGADTIEVNNLFADSMEDYRQRSRIVASAQIYRACAIAACAGSFEGIRIIAPQAADELMHISGVNASFVVFPTGDVVNVSARSMGQINVQVLMERLGGGGHHTMAAAQFPGDSVQNVQTKVVAAIDEYFSSPSTPDMRVEEVIIQES
ncbi:MAG: DHH family phosphoesterase [Oscillospiraceae bacterium]|nr:DHH family phosphoesterase [Oscillospiraceae bacterium]